jgi:hypothetical protein
MISTEQIIKNTKKYFQTAQDHGVMNDELMAFLGPDFIKAPATAIKDQYNAFEGGLIDHLLNVTKYAVIFNNALPETEKVDQKSLIRVCLLHQIGKAFIFIPNTSEWHIKNQGKMYEFDNTKVAMRVSERSVYYAINNGVKLTEEEFSAIIMSDKTDDKMAEFHNTMLGDILKTAILFAIKNEKKRNNG